MSSQVEGETPPDPAASSSFSDTDMYIIIAILSFAIWYFLNRPAKLPVVEPEDDGPPPPLRNYTLKQLKQFDGSTPEGLLPNGNPHKPKPIHLSLGGTVFNVSSGAEYYGPGGSYEFFAGNEIGIALAKMSFEKLYMGNPDLSSLNFSEKEAYNEWFVKFRDIRCYPIVGKLVVDLPKEDQVLTKEEMRAKDGSGDKSANPIPPIYVGVGNYVFDCSFGGVEFYGEGGPYAKFAGIDASRALAKMSFEPEDAASSDLSDLTDKERKVLRDWVKTFKDKKMYPVVGRTGQAFDENAEE
jgi:membrane-associated progesterone receptor component